MAKQYISVGELLDSFYKHGDINKSVRHLYRGDECFVSESDIWRLIFDMPEADVLIATHGKWIERDEEGYNGIQCSECGFSIPYARRNIGYKCCPMCITIMDEED